MDSKACSKCGETKPLDRFYTNPGRGDGRRSDCKSCVLADRRERYAADPSLRARIRTRAAAIDPAVRRDRKERAKKADPDAFAAAARRRHLSREYGITLEQYDEIFNSQGQVCAICRSADPGRSWCVDHDHESGAVRGILCWHCNVGLGHFRDSPLSLAAAIEYVTASSERSEKAS